MTFVCRKNVDKNGQDFFTFHEFGGLPAFPEEKRKTVTKMLPKCIQYLR
jgi:hypothetical protein